MTAGTLSCNKAFTRPYSCRPLTPPASFRHQQLNFRLLSSLHTNGRRRLHRLKCVAAVDRGCTESISSWDDEPYEVLPNGEIVYLDEQDVVTFLDPPKELIPLDPSFYNPATYLWKKIESIPVKRRNRLLSLLEPRLISRAWEIAGMRYDDPKLASKSASSLLADGNETMSLEFWNCRTKGVVQLGYLMANDISHCAVIALNGIIYQYFNKLHLVKEAKTFLIKTKERAINPRNFVWVQYWIKIYQHFVTCFGEQLRESESLDIPSEAYHEFNLLIMGYLVDLGLTHEVVVFERRRPPADSFPADSFPFLRPYIISLFSLGLLKCRHSKNSDPLSHQQPQRDLSNPKPEDAAVTTTTKKVTEVEQQHIESSLVIVNRSKYCSTVVGDFEFETCSTDDNSSEEFTLVDDSTTVQRMMELDENGVHEG